MHTVAKLCFKNSVSKATTTCKLLNNVKALWLAGYAEFSFASVPLKTYDYSSKCTLKIAKCF